MSFESKKELEMDKLNIKSHLNTSLEAESISMSEDLIYRTLNAIRLDEENDINMGKDNSEKGKPVFRLSKARTLIMVAAAALVLLVGLNAIRIYSPLGMKGDMMKSENSTRNDDAGKTEMYSIKEDSVERNQALNDMDETEDLKADMDIAASIDKDIVEARPKESDSVDMLMQSIEEETSENGMTDNAMIDSEEYLLSFNDILMIMPEDISSIIISTDSTGDMSILSDNEQIDKFYSMMEKYSFTRSYEGDTDIQYKIVLSSTNEERQINVGVSSINVTYYQNGESLSSIYTADDHVQLLNDIKYFLTNK